MNFFHYLKVNTTFIVKEPFFYLKMVGFTISIAGL